MNTRFYTKTLSHTGTFNNKMIYDKEKRFKFNRSTKDSDLFLPILNTLADEINDLKAENNRLQYIIKESEK